MIRTITYCPYHLTLLHRTYSKVNPSAPFVLPASSPDAFRLSPSRSYSKSTGDLRCRGSHCRHHLVHLPNQAQGFVQNIERRIEIPIALPATLRMLTHKVAIGQRDLFPTPATPMA